MSENITSEGYDPQAIIDVPTPEIARWLSRLTIINAAISANNSVMAGGGMADDGVLFEYLTDEVERGSDWRHLPLFEEAILYKLKPELDYQKVMERPFSTAAEQFSGRRRLSIEVGQAALREGLQRVGLFSPEEPHVPIGAVAALSFRRANIRYATDRALYEREEEIATACTAVLDTLNIRQVAQTFLDPHTKKEVEHKVPLYTLAPYLTPEQVAQAGLDPHSDLNPWWQELQRDLIRVDEASAAASVSSGNS